VIATMKALEYRFHYNTDKQKDSFWKRILISFIGFSKKEKHPDLWYSTILGTIESFVFPVLMKAELFSAIGALDCIKNSFTMEIMG